MNRECNFHIEIKAPAGLSGIEAHLGKCRLPVETYKSGHNDKIILKSVAEKIEWDMDSSDKEVLVASGYFKLPVDDAWLLLQDLSIALTAGGFPHDIIIDDEKGNKKYGCSFLWGM